MKIEIAVSCHQFQHRFCWMLSSLLQQVGDLPEFVVSAGYIEGTGDPQTAHVLDFFQEQGIAVKHFPYEDHSEFQYRGLVRNAQLAHTDADWIWFADCDMAVPPDYLALLKTTLENPDIANETRMLYSGRYSTEKPCASTDALVASHTYPTVVPDAFRRAAALPKRSKRNIGAGFCQIANVQSVRDNHGGVYVNPRRNPDNAWGRFWKTRSDSRFRRRVGRLRVDLPKFIHLQHVRDNEVGEHIEVQR